MMIQKITQILIHTDRHACVCIKRCKLECEENRTIRPKIKSEKKSAQEMCKFGMKLCATVNGRRDKCVNISHIAKFLSSMSSELWSQFWAIDLNWQTYTVYIQTIGWYMNDGNDQQNTKKHRSHVIFAFCSFFVLFEAETLQCNLEFNCTYSM